MYYLIIQKALHKNYYFLHNSYIQESFHQKLQLQQPMQFETTPIMSGEVATVEPMLSADNELWE
jgi:hypothetical protein